MDPARGLSDKLVLAGASLFGVAMVSLAIAGGISHYSPIPFWDMWNGTVSFINQADRGDVSIWWAQHNEHRIVLSRVLFWIDEKWFEGLSYFLITVNFLLMLASSFSFHAFIRKLLPSTELRYSRLTLTFFLTGLLFSWTQHANIVWAFQGLFFLAYLLPLLALFFSAKYVESGEVVHLWTSIVLGIVSVGTMANGLFALPMVAAHLVLARRSSAAITVTALSGLAFAAYLFDYTSPGGHGSLLATLIQQPADIAVFMLAYLGNPFPQVVALGAPWGTAMAVSAGSALSALMVILVIRARRSGLVGNPYVLALLIFIGYVYITAFLTAGGRVLFGSEAALTSRYTTPVIMAWSSAVILTVALCRECRPGFGLLKFTASVVTLAFLVFQTRAPAADAQVLFDRKVSALALALGVKDDDYIHKVFPDARLPLHISRQAIRQSHSIFGQPPLAGLHLRLGKPTGRPPASDCHGSVEAISHLPDTNGFYRIEGQFMSPYSDDRPELIRLIDGRNIVAGFAMVERRLGPMASGSKAGEGAFTFTGYIHERFVSGQLDIATDQYLCTLEPHAELQDMAERNGA